MRAAGPDGEEFLAVARQKDALLAEILRARNRLREAEASYRQVLALHRKILGPGHPYVAAVERRLASLPPH